MADSHKPCHEHEGRSGCLVVVRRKQRKERGCDFNVEKGKRLFLPHIFFSLFFFFSLFSQKKARTVDFPLHSEKPTAWAFIPTV
jgi:hypothetical protein